MPPEVLIYIQKMKKFFEKDEESRNYFLKDVDEELFFKHLTEISLKNFEKNGTPELHVNQIELLNKTVRALSVKDDPRLKSFTWDLGKLGLIYLN